MSELDDFLAETIPRHVRAARALHERDPEPLSKLLARREDGTWRLVHRQSGGGPHPE